MNVEKIENNKKEFINLLKSTNREGIDKLIEWLSNKSDFFNAPSSTFIKCLLCC